jgi:hypothetical protein
MFTDFEIVNCEICFEPQRITIEEFRGYMNPREVEKCIFSNDKKESKVKALIGMFSNSLECQDCFEHPYITIEDFRGYMNPCEVEECIFSNDKKEPAAEPAPQRASTSRTRGHDVLKVLAVLALLCVPAALATLGGARDAPMCERVVLGAWRACDGVEGLMCAAPVETPAAVGLATRFYVEDAAALEAGVLVQEDGTLTAPVGAAGFTLLAETRHTASGALAYVQPVVVPNAPFKELALTVQEAVLAGATAVGGIMTLYVVDCLLSK